MADQQAQWYYVGQYGELGPLTIEQMQDLCEDKVISQDTFVWREGMTEWQSALEINELRARLTTEPPPPPSVADRPPAPVGLTAPTPPAVATEQKQMTAADWRKVQHNLPRSDKSKVVAGVLNLLFPGIGRIYLGFSAHGVLQFFTAFCLGIGWLWSIPDSIYILLGGVKYDGYGRVLDD